MEIIHHRIRDFNNKYNDDDVKNHYVHWSSLSTFLSNTNSCYSYSALSFARILLEVHFDNKFEDLTLKDSDINLNDDFLFDFMLPISYMDLDKLMKTTEGITFLLFSDFFSSKEPIGTLWNIIGAIYRRLSEITRMVDKFDSDSEEYNLVFTAPEYLDDNGKLNLFFFYYADSMMSTFRLFQFNLYRWNKYGSSASSLSSEVFLEEYASRIDLTYLLKRCYYFYFLLAVNIPLLRKYKYYNPLVDVDGIRFGTDMENIAEKLILSHYPDFDKCIPTTHNELWSNKHRPFTISCLFFLYSRTQSFNPIEQYYQQQFTTNKIYPNFLFCPLNLKWITQLNDRNFIWNDNAYQAYQVIVKHHK